MTTIQHRPDPGLAGIGLGSADKTQTASGLNVQTQAQPQGQPGIVAQPGEVDITPTAQRLAQVEQRISSTPEVDQGRVDAIRQALSNGSYQVDAARVADGVLAAQKFDAQAAAAADGAQSKSARAFATTAQLGVTKG
jgi:negative regulator of flagellin synthesis FlgM